MVSRCFPGGYNVKLYISRGRLAWWLLAFLCCAINSVGVLSSLIKCMWNKMFVLGLIVITCFWCINAQWAHALVPNEVTTCYLQAGMQQLSHALQVISCWWLWTNQISWNWTLKNERLSLLSIKSGMNQLVIKKRNIALLCEHTAQKNQITTSCLAMLNTPGDVLHHN